MLAMTGQRRNATLQLCPQKPRYHDANTAAGKQQEGM